MALATAGTAEAKLDRATAALVLVTVVSLAFNDLVPVLPVGELASDGVIYVFPLLLLALLRRPAAIAAPVSLTLLVLALGAALVVGIALNYETIASAWFKGRSGIGRVTTQGLSLGFGVLIALAFYNLTIRGFLPVVSRAARVALAVMAAVGVLEVAGWNDVPGLAQLHAGLSAVIHGSSGADYPERLRMTAFEVSWAGVMLTFFFPFALIGVEPRGWRMPAMIVLVLTVTILAQSRTALLVLGFQVAYLVMILLRRRVDMFVHGLAVASLVCFALFLSPSVRDRAATVMGNIIEYGSPAMPVDDLGDENVSNVTRLAAIRTGLAMFREHPFFGVGLGQYGFGYPRHLQADDMRSWEVRKYVADAEEDWPPAYSIHARLLAETGIIGYGLWLALILAGLWGGIGNPDLATEAGRARLAVVMTLLGWLLLGASIDSFRFFGGWIAIGVAFALPARGAAASPSGSPA